MAKNLIKISEELMNDVSIMSGRLQRVVVTMEKFRSKFGSSMSPVALKVFDDILEESKDLLSKKTTLVVRNTIELKNLVG